MSMISQPPVKRGFFTHRGHDYTILVACLAGFVFSLFVYFLTADRFSVPQEVIDSFPFAQKVNEVRGWMEANIRDYTRAISNFIKVPLEGLEEALWELPWFFVLVALVLPSLAFGGLRLALLTLIGVCFWGMVDMWYEAMSTLSLMFVSVSFSVVLGVIVGVLASQNDRFEAVLKPILDTMQTMPAFVYLIPAVFFFGVGPAPAAAATIIYAVPPAIRLTSLGIRQVPATMIEAAQSYGSTRLQMLFKVQLPQALPSIMQGVNQTIMMALGLVVLAVFIGAGGLGEQVWNALTRLKVGWAFEGGVAIVFMAVIFDRLSYAISDRSAGVSKAYGDDARFHLLPQTWNDKAWARAIEKPIGLIWTNVSKFSHLVTGSLARAIHPFSKSWPDRIARSPFLIVGGILLVLAYFISPEFKWMNSFPSDWEVSFRAPIAYIIDELTVNPYFIAVTKFIRTSIFLYLLNPLDQFLVGLPYWYLSALIFLIVWVSTSLSFAIITTVFLLFLAAAGLWETSLFTLAGTAVSVLICLFIGVPLGVAAAYSRSTDAILRPILDIMQTMPAFVYLIPAIFFFGGNKTTAVIATVIYAVPPVIRLTTLGLRQLPPEINEVANSYGSTPVQTLMTVKLPMASPSIMLGLNQSVVMALAMQAITPLIGGLGLGKEVFDAMNKADMGKGLAAGIGIVLLTIVLDRLTQGWTKSQRKALGL